MRRAALLPRLALLIAFQWAAASCFAGAGKDGFAFLSMTDGVRDAALGGAGGSLAEEAGESLDNPAALGVIRSREIQMGYASMPLSMSYGALSYLHPLRTGAAALHVRALQYGDITRYDSADTRSGSFSARDTLLAAGWGRPLGLAWSAGVGVREVGESVADRSVSAFAADGGLLYRPSGPVWFSGGVRNVGGGASFVQENTPLPRTFYLGASARFFSDAWVLAGEGRRSPSGTSYHLGQELWLYNAMALRAGWSSDRDLGNGLSLGLGWKVRSIRLDYSFSPWGGAFGQVHRLGLSFRFSGAGEDAYQEGLKLAQSDHHAEAILKFKEALDADPGNRNAVRSLRESVGALEKERGSR